MPIYAYRCAECGHAKDVLQKLSDAPLTTCPACHAEAFTKQITAAGFQLKGSGWYATDFKGGGTPATSAPATSAAAPVAPAETSSASSTSSSTDSSGGGSAGGAASCGGSCACH
ncbi:FmdB family zinc ribbon protein [Roseateles koreensis]|uniref:Zinc ribbon domain-containing protein n=1 Tax=Roseateles koreensis TaxID=2987526 RepID=A0ABT5KUQ8_9BURK|nr:FmdB family zinc ribbon protein [Roseateles koreensis]MDC8786669.1 zinc ribbon domain-containing protein [Roseateles koreensis]